MKIIERPSTNFSKRPDKVEIDTIVIHYTGMQSCESAIARMRDKNFEVSCHYCIDRNGDIYQLVRENKKAWHSGKSFWAERKNINDYSIGIELVNNGHEWGYESFPDAQIESLIELCKNIISRYKINPKNIVGHSDIAPDRKEDPGELFPWGKLAQNGIGIFHDRSFDSGEYDNHVYTVSEIIKTKENLAKIGYYVHPSDILDKQFNSVLTAFYRRFFYKRIMMQKDLRYPKRIYLDGIAIQLISEVAKAYEMV